VATRTRCDSLGSVFELNAGCDEGDELWAVDLPPAGLGSVKELVGHHQPASTSSGAFGDLGA
jgi:hypothetical protein